MGCTVTAFPPSFIDFYSSDLDFGGSTQQPFQNSATTSNARNLIVQNRKETNHESTLFQKLRGTESHILREKLKAQHFSKQ